VRTDTVTKSIQQNMLCDNNYELVIQLMGIYYFIIITNTITIVIFIIINTILSSMI